MSRTEPLPSWSSRLGFMLSCIGAAVGLGNIWKFPYIVGEQGGGAFVLIYLISIVMIAIPIAAAELITGRAGRTTRLNACDSVKHITPKHHPSIYAPIGLIGIFTSFLLMTFYAVIAGWVMAYIFRAISGDLTGLMAGGSEAVFKSLHANPIEQIFWQILFIVMIGVVISRDLRSGLERANIILIPLLLLMLFGVIVYAILEADIMAALHYLFTPDFSKINAEVVLSAIGHSFFSVGVGAAIFITYGAYMADSIKIGRASVLIGLADTMLALLAGLGIFAIVFAQNLDPAAGPGLIFITLPLAFTGLPGGTLLGVIFFLLILFAALTSALSLTEVPVRWLDETTKLGHKGATILTLTLMFIVGLATVFSFNIWADVRITDSGIFADKNLFEVKDYMASNILLPIGGLLIVTFAAWVVPTETTREFFNEGKKLHLIWLWLARFVAPLGIIWVFLANL